MGAAPPADGDEVGPGAPEDAGAELAGGPDAPAEDAGSTDAAGEPEAAGAVDGLPGPDGAAELVGAGSWAGTWVKPGADEPHAASMMSARRVRPIRPVLRTRCGASIPAA